MKGDGNGIADLETVVLAGATTPVRSRWKPDHDERVALAAGGTIELQQITYGHGIQPVSLVVVPHVWEHEDVQVVDEACPLHGPNEGEGNCWPCHVAAVMAGDGEPIGV